MFRHLVIDLVLFMKLAVISHKSCWRADSSPSGYVTDGGFPLQMKAISELFDETKLLVPCSEKSDVNGASPILGKDMNVISLSDPKGYGIRRKLNMLGWVVKNGYIIWREIRRSDAVHAPIPGDVGTIGMLFAMLQRKPLFVRHCGNWLVQRTTAEQFWKWSMESFAGGRNVMFATGGTDQAPSAKNSHIKWIFSTSLRQENIDKAIARTYPENGELKLITACRLEERKGVDVVIESLSLILKDFPKAKLDIVGGGSLEQKLKEQVNKLGLNENVKFHGKVAQSKVIELMKQAHVFCFPTSASEGFPKVVIEALACGLPVITSKVSVLPKLIGDSCGVTLKSPTSENVAEAIRDIISKDEIYENFSNNAINTAKQYSLESWRDFIGENLRKSWNVTALSSDK